MTRLLGLDVGTRTIGVAVSDMGGVVATPLRTVRRSTPGADIEAVSGLLAETGATALVVGLPLDLRGREGEAARRSRVVGDALKEALGCEVTYWDERFSTSEAERVLLELDAGAGRTSAARARAHRIASIYANRNDGGGEAWRLLCAMQRGFAQSEPRLAAGYGRAASRCRRRLEAQGYRAAE